MPQACPAPLGATPSRSDPQNADQFANAPGGFIERGLFLRGQFDFDDLLDAVAPSFTGTPTKSPLMPYSPSR